MNHTLNTKRMVYSSNADAPRVYCGFGMRSSSLHPIDPFLIQSLERVSRHQFGGLKLLDR